MNASAVERTNLLLLRILKNNGVNFSETAQHIIDRKDNPEQSLTFISALGILVSKFTDYIKEHLTRSSTKGVGFDAKAFNSIKNQLKDVKSEACINQKQEKNNSSSSSF